MSAEKSRRFLFLHGLGQGPSSWENVLRRLPVQEPVCMDLVSMLQSGDMRYEGLFRQFETACQGFSGKLHLCGISLGAVLALHYAVEHPQKVQSLILIAPQFKMPKAALALQNVLFRCMPEKPFAQMGLSKKAVIALTASMRDLDFQDKIKALDCPAAVVCGKRDKANMRAAVSFCDQSPNARLYVIEQAGHEVNIDAPERLAEVIKSCWWEAKM